MATSTPWLIPSSDAAPSHPHPPGYLLLAVLTGSWSGDHCIDLPGPFLSPPAASGGTCFDFSCIAGVNSDLIHCLSLRVSLNFCLHCSGHACTLAAHHQQGFPSPCFSPETSAGTKLPAASWASSSQHLLISVLYIFSSSEL